MPATEKAVVAYSSLREPRQLLVMRGGVFGTTIARVDTTQDGGRIAEELAQLTPATLVAILQIDGSRSAVRCIPTVADPTITARAVQEATYAAISRGLVTRHAGATHFSLTPRGFRCVSAIINATEDRAS